MPWKKIEVTYGETGSGVSDRVETEYQFGDEIDGVWVPAVTKASGYIEHLIEREKAAQAANQPPAAETPADAGDSAA